MHISWARLASFCHLGFISDPLIVSKFHNITHVPKWQENKIYTIVKGRETFYRRHTVPFTSCSEVKYVLWREVWNMALYQMLSQILAEWCLLDHVDFLWKDKMQSLVVSGWAVFRKSAFSESHVGDPLRCDACQNVPWHCCRWYAPVICKW